MGKRLEKFFNHCFFPQESNNYKAKSLHLSSLTYYIFLIVLFQIAVSFTTNYQKNVLGFATDVTIEKILMLVNREREKNNLAPLTLSPELSTAAVNKASDMFVKNYWAHISPTGTTPWQFILNAGYNYVYAGENLAKNFDNSEQVVTAWMNSPSHRANILKPEYNEIGVAVINGRLNGEETTLVVQEFGRKNTGVVPAVLNSDTGANQQKDSQETALQLNRAQELPVKSKAVILPFKISKTVSLILVEFLLFLLFIDSIFIWKHKLIRISGHSISHIFFFLSLIAAIGISGAGVIL